MSVQIQHIGSGVAACAGLGKIAGGRRRTSAISRTSRFGLSTYQKWSQPDSAFGPQRAPPRIVTCGHGIAEEGGRAAVPVTLKAHGQPPQKFMPSPAAMSKSGGEQLSACYLRHTDSHLKNPCRHLRQCQRLGAESVSNYHFQRNGTSAEHSSRKKR